MKPFSRLAFLLIALVTLVAAIEVSSKTRVVFIRASMLHLVSSWHLTKCTVSFIIPQTERFLGGKDVPYDPSRDECEIGRDDRDRPIFGACIPAIHFPNCGDDSFVCYNRANRRDKFYEDKNPWFYINPRRALCYQNDWLKWGGCSSCTPGRFCLAENRCILDEKVYNCSRWL